MYLYIYCHKEEVAAVVGCSVGEDDGAVRDEDDGAVKDARGDVTGKDFQQSLYAVSRHCLLSSAAADVGFRICSHAYTRRVCVFHHTGTSFMCVCMYECV